MSEELNEEVSKKWKQVLLVLLEASRAYGDDLEEFDRNPQASIKATARVLESAYGISNATGKLTLAQLAVLNKWLTS